MKNNNGLPPVVAGMSDAELVDFETWLQNCCGTSMDDLTPDKMEQSAYTWYDLIYEYGEQ